MSMEEPDFAELFSILLDEQKMDRYLVQLAMLPLTPTRADEIVVGDFGFKVRDLPVLAICRDIGFNKRYPECTGKITIKKKEQRRMVYRCGTCGANRANLSGYHVVRYMAKTTAFWARIYARKRIGVLGQATRSQILLILYCTAYGMSPLEIMLVLGKRFATTIETVKRWQQFVRKMMASELRQVSAVPIKMEMKPNVSKLREEKDLLHTAYEYTEDNTFGPSTSVSHDHDVMHHNSGLEEDTEEYEVDIVGTPTSHILPQESALSNGSNESEMCNDILEFEREDEDVPVFDENVQQQDDQAHNQSETFHDMYNENASLHDNGSDVASECGSDLPRHILVKPSVRTSRGVPNLRRRKDAFLNLVRIINKHYTFNAM